MPVVQYYADTDKSAGDVDCVSVGIGVVEVHGYQPTVLFSLFSFTHSSATPIICHYSYGRSHDKGIFERLEKLNLWGENDEESSEAREMVDPIPEGISACRKSKHINLVDLVPMCWFPDCDLKLRAHLSGAIQADLGTATFESFVPRSGIRT
ncbi:hypothetical protein BC827DRAFT_1158342 [Russula dissimulans]|nr:hypothetical protein BC827DRAFT_1158342 [Russula dissimulans]